MVVEVGAIITTLVNGWLENRKQDTANGVSEAAATASVFQSLMLENARLTALLVEAVKTLDAKVQAMEAENDDLKHRLEAFEDSNNGTNIQHQ